MRIVTSLVCRERIHRRVLQGPRVVVHDYLGTGIRARISYDAQRGWTLVFYTLSKLVEQYDSPFFSLSDIRARKSRAFLRAEENTRARLLFIGSKRDSLSWGLEKIPGLTGLRINTRRVSRVSFLVPISCSQRRAILTLSAGLYNARYCPSHITCTAAHLELSSSSVATRASSLSLSPSRSSRTNEKRSTDPPRADSLV